MTPFYQLLKDEEIADVLTHIRTSWRSQAPETNTLVMANDRNAVRSAK
jgi:hypothetical protein